MRGDVFSFPQYVFLAWCLVKHRLPFTYCCLICQLVNIQTFLCYARDISLRNTGISCLDVLSVLR